MRSLGRWTLALVFSVALGATPVFACVGGGSAGGSGTSGGGAGASGSGASGASGESSSDGNFGMEKVKATLPCGQVMHNATCSWPSKVAPIF
jgi:hypothetical protein